MSIRIDPAATELALPVLRVVFTDFDGVLNNAKTSARYRHPKRPGGIMMGIDPANVAVFNQLLSALPLKVVVTSSWRWTHTLEELRAILSGAGIRGEVLGKTGTDYPGNRGKEIQAWIDKNGPVDSFVVLDDSEDMGMLTPRLVRTTPATGLQEKHVGAALKLFGVSTPRDNHPF